MEAKNIYALCSFISFFALVNHYSSLNFTIWSQSRTQLIIWLGVRVCFPSFVPFTINLYVNKISCILCLNNVHAIYIWMAWNDLQNTHIARKRYGQWPPARVYTHITYTRIHAKALHGWHDTCERVPHQHSREHENKTY